MVFGIGRKREQGFMPGGMPGMQPLEPAAGLPTQQVINLRQQGLTDNQIITALQRDGYTSDQIYSALNQVGMQAAGPMQMMGQEEMMPMQAEEQPSQAMPQMPQPMPMQGTADEERIAEVAERIIDEKWEDITKSITKMDEWKEKTDSAITRMQQQIEDLKGTVDNLHKAIIGKIEEYDQNLTNVGTEIKAMEKVFQKILPTFTENVGELSRITKGMKGKK